MKNIIYNKLYSFLLFISVLALLQGCQKVEEIYPEVPKRVFITQAAPAGTTRLTVTASGKKTISPVTFRVFVNKLYDVDVTAPFIISGTAVVGQDFNPPASSSVVIPAGSYYTDVAFTVLNNVAQISSKTVIITLINTADGFEAGLGRDYKYKVFTYTITP